MLNAKLFGEKVREQRASNTLREVEKHLQISASTLSRIERGHKPDVDTFLILLHWMNGNIDDLFDYKSLRTLSKRIHSDVN